MLVPGALWRGSQRQIGRYKTAYLTFDDGPIPQVTPWVLDMLDRYGVKATFFMVGDNANRYPELVAEVRRRGHTIGNHTMHHDQGLSTSRKAYLKSVDEAQSIIRSDLFRPPHGLLGPLQLMSLRQRFRIVMHDLVTMDYDSRQWPWEIIDRVRRLIRPGSIIVFHDSLKAQHNLESTLENVISWLLDHDYRLLPL